MDELIGRSALTVEQSVRFNDSNAMSVDIAEIVLVINWIELDSAKARLADLSL